MTEKTTIGRTDKADFPELDLQDIDLKIDTGAYTSAIHCKDIETKEQDGKTVLTFKLLDDSHSQYDGKEFATEHFKEKSIKSSNGSSEERYVVQTDIRLFGVTYPIQLSLSDRGEMRFPILIGRRFLKGKFIVDAARRNLSHKKKLATAKKQAK
ncbi:ATP-dependent zinc protease family protein [Neolewinella antarctica]|uniref:Retropepsin-like aspartic endopeptidase domain-containing protein n=1 Tax=Neolewinella antarctica TaxID=442734 RepID=A0ABX0XFB8_9BACT|nr:RimK/LysX family protein [Neolewinella antarctica]NJC28015.1 hypothetical protein [Neolewinella antarctica]